MDIDERLDELEASAYVYAIGAGAYVSLLWGDDRERLLDRVAIIRYGLIGANLDPEIVGIRPAKVRDAYTALVREIGHKRINFLD